MCYIKTMVDRFLGKTGLSEHKVIVEEMDGDEKRLRQLTVDYLRGKIDLKDYKNLTDQLPKLNLRKLAQDLKFKG